MKANEKENCKQCNARPHSTHQKANWTLRASRCMAISSRNPVKSKRMARRARCVSRSLSTLTLLSSLLQCWMHLIDHKRRTNAKGQSAVSSKDFKDVLLLCLTVFASNWTELFILLSINIFSSVCLSVFSCESAPFFWENKAEKKRRRKAAMQRK